MGKSYKGNDIPWPNEFDHTTRRCVLVIKTILVDFDRPLLVRIPIRIAGINPIGDLGTAPDSLITPEPATMVLLGLGGLFVGRRRS
ncbi:MAG: PEP-CTERM sorting domain-containing protein [Planctomycetota bacterium]